MLKERIRFYVRSNQSLGARLGSQKIDVSVLPCFPWSNPEQYLSIRNREGQEVYLLRDVQELDAESKACLFRFLREVQFVFTIQKVESIVEDIELRHYTVKTQEGRRKFQTKLDHWPLHGPHGKIFIRDLSGDLYQIPCLSQLDESSREKLSHYVD